MTLLMAAGSAIVLGVVLLRLSTPTTRTVLLLLVATSVAVVTVDASDAHGATECPPTRPRPPSR